MQRLILGLVMLVASLNAQQQEQQFFNASRLTIVGTGVAWCNSNAVDKYGNAWITCFNRGNPQAAVYRYSMNGNRTLVINHGTAVATQPRALAVDNEREHIYLIGWCNGALDGIAPPGNSTMTDAFITKFGFDGTKYWSRLWGWSQSDGFSSITLDGSFLYIGGFANSTSDGTPWGSAASRSTAIKMTLDGDIVWSRVTTTKQFENGAAIAVNDNEIIVSNRYDIVRLDKNTGTIIQTFDANIQRFMVMFDSGRRIATSGVVSGTGFTRVYNTTTPLSNANFREYVFPNASNPFNALAVNTETQEIYACGATNGAYDFPFSKLDKDGRVIWSVTLVGRGNCFGMAYEPLTRTVIMAYDLSTGSNGGIGFYRDSYSLPSTTSATPTSTPGLNLVLPDISQGNAASNSLKAENRPDNMSGNALQLTPLIIGAVAVGAVVLFPMSGFAVHRYLQRKRATESATYTESKLLQTSESTSNNMYSTSVVLPTISTTMYATLVGPGDEISVPAFIEKKFGFDFVKDSFVAQGGGGTIYTCKVFDDELKVRSGGRPLAVKYLGGSLNTMTERMQNAFKQEVSLMFRTRDHPNFVKLFAFSYDPLCIVMRLYEFGDFSGFIHGKSRAASEFIYAKCTVVRVLKQVCDGIAFLHSIGLAHCDIKPANILLDVNEQDQLVPIISDLGISRILDPSELKVGAFQVSNIKGASLAYAAPDLLHVFRQKMEDHDPQVWTSRDVYALSITMYEALARRRPWTKESSSA